MHSRIGGNQERGLALILAMMIVALVATIATEISWRFELNMSRNANRWAGMQAKAYLRGAEDLAMWVLKQDQEDEIAGVVDHLGESWAGPGQQFPTDHGWIEGRIEDALGRFNVNLMQPEPGMCPNGDKPKNGGQPTLENCPEPSECDKYTNYQRLFIRLLQTFNVADVEDPEPVYLEEGQARLITDAVIDWLDPDSEIRGFGGAESDYYEGLDPPIAIGNQQMISVTELQVIKGMNELPQLYRQLVQYVIALPKDKADWINIHTATTPILRSVRTGDLCDLTPFDEEVGGELKSFMQDNSEDLLGWDDIKGHPGLPPEWFKAGSQDELDPLLQTTFKKIGQSSYFLFFGTAAIGEEYVRTSASMIRRNGNGEGGDAGNGPPLEIIRRSDANF